MAYFFLPRNNLKGVTHMRKATIQILYDAEKLRAIRRYKGNNEDDLQTELDDEMQKLYEKHVPAPVREYIESRDSRVQEKPKRPARSSSTAAANNDANTTV